MSVLPSGTRVRIGFEHARSILQQSSGTFDTVQRRRHILFQNDVIAAVDRFFTDLNALMTTKKPKLVKQHDIFLEKKNLLKTVASISFNLWRIAVENGAGLLWFMSSSEFNAVARASSLLVLKVKDLKRIDFNWINNLWPSFSLSS